MSEHRVLVLRIKSLSPIEKADRIELAQVGLSSESSDWPTVVPKGTYSVGDLVVFVEPDYEVPNTEQFSHLFKNPDESFTRIKAVKLRGVKSYGVCVAAPAGAVEGQDVMKAMNIRRWVSKAESSSSGEDQPVPAKLRVSAYDVESFRHRSQASILSEGVCVVATEKIHGANWRACFLDGEIYVGSRNRWIRKPGEYTVTKPGVAKGIWQHFKSIFGWKPAPVTVVRTAGPSYFWDGLSYELECLLRANPGVIFYGEVYGQPVQGKSFQYDADPGRVRVRIFDAFDIGAGKWLGADMLRATVTESLLVPVVYRGKYDRDKLESLIEKDSSLGAGQVREGVVIKSETMLPEGHDRLCAKMVSIRYLGKS